MAIGNAAASEHYFGEGVQAHHIIPNKMGGPITKENCVIICRACHYSAHQGGHWGNVKIYDDLRTIPRMDEKIAKIAALYPHYNG